jgi:site-specific recombinase XerD
MTHNATEQDIIQQTTDAWQQTYTAWLLNFNSDRTRQAYNAAVLQFFELAHKHASQVEQADAIAYKAWLTKQGYAQSTINQRLAALSSFYTYAIDKGLCSENPTAGVKRKAINPYGKASYLDTEADQHRTLLDQPDRDSLQGLRDYAVMLTLMTTGLRVSALADATTADLKPTQAGYVLQFENKGGETSQKRLQPQAVAAINAYLAKRKDKPTSSLALPGQTRKAGPLFATVPSPRSKKGGEPLTRHAITKMISRYAKAAGLHHITAHSLRHTFAVMAQQHGTVAEVSAALDHKNTRVTTIYLDHVNTASIDALFDKVGDVFEGMN